MFIICGVQGQPNDKPIMKNSQFGKRFEKLTIAQGWLDFYLSTNQSAVPRARQKALLLQGHANVHIVR